MLNSNYVRSCAYESYIRLARQCGREEFHAHNAHIKNLMDAESALVFKPKEHGKWLTAVKMYMTEASRLALKRRLSKEDKVEINSYIPRIEEAESVDELLQICDAGREVFLKYKIE